MYTTQIIGYLLAVFIGISLGLLGSGGSILSVPIFVYVFKIEPVLATTYSLFVVGITALFAGIQKALQKLVDFNKVVLFGIPTIASVLFTRKIIVAHIPKYITIYPEYSVSKSMLIMLVFAVVMFFAALQMIRPLQITKEKETQSSYVLIIFYGLLIGAIAGFVGAGGGFLIIPALLLLAKTPMKIAVGTSLFIVALQSLMGFLGDVSSSNIDWKLLLQFTSFAFFGVFIGNKLSYKIPANTLKVYFGYFIIVMAIFIVFKEVVLA
ncbi:sulfite exporter TauE/SafE family protein [Flavobacterium croceum]|uniref:Probable membrane transporter protein n=1 Tax=Flavobacterium croceum DSM 17960 TaxID=1121886 RepID=A0A2S4N5Z7_9FLAO|nr:sulfite exporter TauE/SafE family protein [Flavobacterium croceum]POS01142.1 hypothetical protein Q361_11321 [Flavobacterium croceum DSM 17960]